MLIVGAPYILLRNINPQEGHCNGTRYILIDMSPRLVRAVIAVGPYKGRVLLLPRIVNQTLEHEFPFILSRRQFPLQLGFAVTVHKAQGLTFDRVGVYLPQFVFTHGMLYVACSRVGALHNLKIYLPDLPEDDNQTDDSHSQVDDRCWRRTRNVVYKEVLQKAHPLSESESSPALPVPL